MADERDAGSPGVDTTRLEAEFIDATVSSRFRYTAHVPGADGVRVAVQRDVDLQPAPEEASEGRERAPWRILRARQWRLAAPEALNAGDPSGE